MQHATRAKKRTGQPVAMVEPVLKSPGEMKPRNHLTTKKKATELYRGLSRDAITRQSLCNHDRRQARHQEERLRPTDRSFYCTGRRASLPVDQSAFRLSSFSQLRLKENLASSLSEIISKDKYFTTDLLLHSLRLWSLVLIFHYWNFSDSGILASSPDPKSLFYFSRSSSPAVVPHFSLHGPCLVTVFYQHRIAYFCIIGSRVFTSGR